MLIIVNLLDGVLRSAKIFEIVGVLNSSILISVFDVGVLFNDGDPNLFESNNLCVNRGISISKLGSSSGFFFTLLGVCGSY